MKFFLISVRYSSSELLVFIRWFDDERAAANASRNHRSRISCRSWRSEWQRNQWKIQQSNLIVPLDVNGPAARTAIKHERPVTQIFASSTLFATKSNAIQSLVSSLWMIENNVSFGCWWAWILSRSVVLPKRISLIESIKTKRKSRNESFERKGQIYSALSTLFSMLETKKSLLNFRSTRKFVDIAVRNFELWETRCPRTCNEDSRWLNRSMFSSSVIFLFVFYRHWLSFLSATCWTKRFFSLELYSLNSNFHVDESSNCLMTMNDDGCCCCYYRYLPWFW